MRAAFRELIRVAPRLVALWLAIVVPGIFVIALVTGSSRVEALTLAVGAIPAGVPLVGFMWLDPLARSVAFSWARFMVALLWAAVTAIPAIPIGILLVELVRGMGP